MVICPTKALEHDMEPNFQAAGLRTLVINADTTRAALARRDDVWKLAAAERDVILLSPEQLATSGFRRLMDERTF
ncbi:hypothetical protein EVJ58_g8454 [Rhodofomes roseus]|uniref:Uncharacterized protein n=1 Tax=Rhodofomes roseus TaxID=34475 RepID=A0A4Y9XZJ7_9APHY|nr:hypothetical protein EVJ58_g8454 [Rhodofomes roseus]